MNVTNECDSKMRQNCNAILNRPQRPARCSERCKSTYIYSGDELWCVQGAACKSGNLAWRTWLRVVLADVPAVRH